MNLRTRFEKIILKAELTPWPKFFQNLRSTRQTELSIQGFAPHIVCAWIGNTEAVANKHYLQVPDSEFERAAAGRLRDEITPKRALQNPVQQDAVLGRVPEQAQQEGLAFAGKCEALQDGFNKQAPRLGLEPRT